MAIEAGPNFFLSIRNYFGDGIYLLNFLKNSGKNEKDKNFSKTLYWNTFKCILIVNTMLFAYEFTKGRQFYGVYIKAFLKSCVFGSFYSIYFNNVKLEEYLVKKQIEQAKIKNI